MAGGVVGNDDINQNTHACACVLLTGNSTSYYTDLRCVRFDER